MANRVFGYVRVSTEEQAEHGVSVEAQEAAIRSYCNLHGLELVEPVVFDNGLSGATLAKRPGLMGALGALRFGEAGGIVIVKLDRLSRSTRDVLDLVDRSAREGWHVHSIREKLDTSTAAGRFVVTVLAGLAQMEREQTSERTRAALAHLRSQGKRTSGLPPFGFRFDGNDLVEAPGEKAILNAMQIMRLKGLGSVRIAREMNECGPNPRTGRPWTRGSIASILKTAERRRAS